MEKEQGEERSDGETALYKASVYSSKLKDPNPIEILLLRWSLEGIFLFLFSFFLGPEITY